MPPPTKIMRPNQCSSTREIRHIRLHLAALGEIIEELSTVKCDNVRMSALADPMPVDELLRRCLHRQEAVRRQLVATN